MLGFSTKPRGPTGSSAMASIPSSPIRSSTMASMPSCGESSGCEVNRQHNDQGFDIKHESSFDSNAPIKDNEKMIEEPRIGMEFSSDESVFKFYSNYGGKNGFNVRKQYVRKSKTGFVTRRTFVCSKEGQRKEDKRSEHAFYRLPLSRVDCKAHMTCKIQKNGKYRIVSFDPKHNHELVRTPLKHTLRVNRRLICAQKAHADEADKSGKPIKSTKELMGRENHCFTDKDYRNYIHRKRKMAMEKGDARAILQYFQKMQSENSSYFYSIQLDEDDMITNIFWADARSISDYGLFGDVVCFDTTYRTNDYGRPFAPIIGVNHHRQTVVFGAALLYDETVDSFKWLFETFLGAMSGKQPKTIITDRSDAMATAIFEVLPETHHRLCVWHIYQNAAKHLSHVFNGTKEFVHDLNDCIYDHEDEDAWLLAWRNMLEKYNLTENIWLKTLFEEKEKWALVYGRHIFCADMKTTQRSESMNTVLKKYLKPKHDLLRFFEHYESVLADRRYEELITDFNMMQTSPSLSASVEMLRHGAEVYTPEVFELFQNEYTKFLNCNVFKVGKSGTTSDYKVTYAGKSKEHVVKFEASTHEVVCSCMKFTFLGILCAHALKVLDKKNVKKIPPQYIMTRWTRDAKARSVSDYRGIEIHDNPKESMGKRYGHLCRNFREIASFAAEHEKLAKYAHESAVVLLKNLQEMKKKVFEDNSSVIPNMHGETSFGGNEQVGKIPPYVDKSTSNALGVKRKASTVVRRLVRLKDPLERQRHKAKSNPPKNSMIKPTSIQKKQHDGGHSDQGFDIRKQHDDGHNQYFDVWAQDNGPHSRFHTHLATTSMHENFGSGTSPFTQLLQVSLAHYGSLPQSKEKEQEFGNRAA